MADAAVLKELAPTGKLRIAIAVAPTPSAQFAIKDAFRRLSRRRHHARQALAKKLGVDAELIVHNGSGEIQNSAADNKWDVAFLPVDEERKKFVDFGNAYHLLQSTYLVAPGAKLNAVAEANAAGVRIGGVANTATFRTSQKTAPKATFVTFKAVDEAIAAMKNGEIDAMALSRESLTRRRAEDSRLAHPRWRIFEFDNVGGRPQEQAGGASLCQRLHRRSEKIRPGAPGLRRDGAEVLDRCAGRDEILRRFRRVDVLRSDPQTDHARGYAPQHREPGHQLDRERRLRPFGALQ